MNQTKSSQDVAVCLAVEAHRRTCSCPYSFINSVDTAGRRAVHYQDMCLSLRGHAHHLHKFTSKTLGQAAFKKKNCKEAIIIISPPERVHRMMEEVLSIRQPLRRVIS